MLLPDLILLRLITPEKWDAAFLIFVNLSTVNYGFLVANVQWNPGRFNDLIIEFFGKLHKLQEESLVEVLLLLPTTFATVFSGRASCPLMM
jgi:hypothetical protein